MTPKVSPETLDKLTNVAACLEQLKAVSEETAAFGKPTELQVEDMLKQLEQVITLFEDILDASDILGPAFKDAFAGSMHKAIDNYVGAAIEHTDSNHPDLYKLLDLRTKLKKMCPPNPEKATV